MLVRIASVSEAPKNLAKLRISFESPKFFSTFSEKFSFQSLLKLRFGNFIGPPSELRVQSYNLFAKPPNIFAIFLIYCKIFVRKSYLCQKIPVFGALPTLNQHLIFLIFYLNCNILHCFCNNLQQFI